MSSLYDHHADSTATLAKWWGEFQFNPHQSRAWRFGSFYVRISRDEKEWRIESHRPSQQHQHQLKDWQSLETSTALPLPTKTERFMFNKTHSSLFLMPRLADRSIVIKPVQPIFIPAGQQSKLFISTPLWLCGYVKSDQELLFDYPIIQPKDTWFGQNKMVGKLCYSTAVDGNTDLNLLSPNAFRAVTPVHVYNYTNKQIHLEKMNVPIYSLSLFYNVQTHRLWTPEIKVFQEHHHHQNVRIMIDSNPPSHAGQVQRIHVARQQHGNFITDMFDNILG